MFIGSLVTPLGDCVLENLLLYGFFKFDKRKSSSFSKKEEG